MPVEESVWGHLVKLRADGSAVGDVLVGGCYGDVLLADGECTFGIDVQDNFLPSLET